MDVRLDVHVVVRGENTIYAREGKGSFRCKLRTSDSYPWRLTASSGHVARHPAKKERRMITHIVINVTDMTSDLLLGWTNGNWSGKLV